MYRDYPSFSSSNINGNKDNGSVGGVGVGSLLLPRRYGTRSTCRFSDSGIIGGDGGN